MLLDTVRVGPNTYMGASRVYDEAMAAPSSVSRALLDPFLRGVTFLATEGLDEILANKANQQCHFKTYRALDVNVSTGIVMGAAMVQESPLQEHTRRIASILVTMPALPTSIGVLLL